MKQKKPDRENGEQGEQGDQDNDMQQNNNFGGDME